MCAGVDAGGRNVCSQQWWVKTSNAATRLITKESPRRLSGKLSTATIREERSTVVAKSRQFRRYYTNWTGSDLLLGLWCVRLNLCVLPKMLVDQKRLKIYRNSV